MTETAATALPERAMPEPSRSPRGRRWVERWDPEDREFWQSEGARVARRNLSWSILAEFLGFSVWQLWSVVVVLLPTAGFSFSVNQRFWIVAVASLVGAFARVPYTFAVPRFGGRNWTIVSVLLLLLPITLLVVCVTDRATPYWMFVVAAATAGFGGGNFASSMTNISFFYPESRKGLALGLNAAGGNVGVAAAQLLVPVVVGIGTTTTLAHAGVMWLPLLVAALAGAWWGMDNLSTARSAPRAQLNGMRRAHTWVMAVLYVGTFGSFIGYSAAMPLLINTQFPGVTGGYAFLGPLVGSAFRPLGGLLADHVGGARVTFWNFVVMALGVTGGLAALEVHSFGLFLGSFLLLFATSGIGNGSTYRMIPAIFRARADAQGASPEAVAGARREAGAVIGLVSAIGAVGGFIIPRALGSSIARTGGIDAALYTFLAFYAVCVLVTWWFYLRRALLAERVPSLAAAGV